MFQKKLERERGDGELLRVENERLRQEALMLRDRHSEQQGVIDGLRAMLKNQ